MKDPKPRLTMAVPRLVVQDIVKTAEYYRDRLGFQIDNYWRKPPIQALLSRDGVQLSLDLATTGVASSNREFRDDGVDVHFVVEQLDSLAEELRDRKAYLVLEPRAYGSGGREFRVLDCNGFVLAFVEPVPTK